MGQMDIASSLAWRTSWFLETVGTPAEFGKLVPQLAQYGPFILAVNITWSLELELTGHPIRKQVDKAAMASELDSLT